MKGSNVYEQHFAFVWGCLRRLGVAACDLEDATHDAFVVAHRRRAELAQASSPRAWMFGVVRRVASNYRRGIARHRRRVGAVRDLGARATEPDRDVERTDAAHVVTRFLDELDAPQREIFVLSELLQLTAREAGEVLAINPNTASARLRAARKAFEGFAARVREENPIDTAAALAHVRRADRPSAEARARVGGALAASLGSPLGAASAVAPGLGAFAKASAVALALAGGTLGVVAAVASTMREPASDRSSSPAPLATASSVASAHAPGPGTGSTEIPASVASASAPAWGTPLRNVASGTPAERSEPTATATHPAGASGSAAVEPVPARRSVPTSATAHDDRGALATDDLAAQNDLLSRARGALARKDGADAARLARAYRERFTAGALLTEMELVEIRAHCITGEVEAARRLGRRFADAHPGSPHVAIIEGTCVGPITKVESSGH